MDQLTFVEKVAQKLTHLGLTGPAVLLLEAHKPLAFIGSQFLLVAQPSLNLFIPSPLTQNLIDLLADPAQLEQLIARLEQNPSPKLESLELSARLSRSNFRGLRHAARQMPNGAASEDAGSSNLDPLRLNKETRP